MNVKKLLFDAIFIIISSLFLVILIYFDLTEKYIGFALIPILIAYQLGKYYERKFRK